MAITALTFFSAFKTSIVTLTIFLSTHRFFASALPSRHIWSHSLEIIGMAVIYETLSFSDFLNIVLHIMTTDTDTMFPTNFPLGKALAIKFKTIYFCTFATLWLLRRRTPMILWGMTHMLSIGQLFRLSFMWLARW